MTNRLTRRWTKTAGEAFGQSGVKGRQGELLVASILEEQSIPFQDFEEEKHQQISGIDLQVGTHSIDVKSNLNGGVFFMEVNRDGWLFNPKKTSDIIIHIDTQTRECVWYTRKAAKASIRPDNYRDLVKITPSKTQSYMSRSWDDLIQFLKT